MHLVHENVRDARELRVVLEGLEGDELLAGARLAAEDGEEEGGDMCSRRRCTDVDVDVDFFVVSRLPPADPPRFVYLTLRPVLNPRDIEVFVWFNANAVKMSHQL